MSLLMQALKKAERAKQSHLGEDEAAKAETRATTGWGRRFTAWDSSTNR